VLAVADVTLRYGGVTALDQVSLEVQAGETCALIGPNGAGKTSLFNVISGIHAPHSGEVQVDGRSLLRTRRHQLVELGISRTFQNLALFSRLTVLENVMVGAVARRRYGFVSAIARTPRARRSEHKMREIAAQMLERLHLSDCAHRFVEELPYGTRKRIELARALAAEPKLLLLDEPASGLGHAEVDELATLLRELRVEQDLTLLIVEHHMSLVRSVADQVVVLNLGQVLATGKPAEVAQRVDVVRAYLGDAA
jgi:branched-chain amino acid transport system ATP-binding protein